jgi:hypothetical protein
MIEQMLGKRTAAQLTAGLKIIVAALSVIALSLVVIAVTSIIAVG